MLYSRWLETSRRYADRTAIFDGEQQVTFADLSVAVSLTPRAEGPVIARSGGLGFFVEILRAWRDGQAVIPVEREAAEPVLHCAPMADTRLVKYTPGASGIPRGIFLNDEQLMADGDRLYAAMELSPKIPNLAVISMAHSYGFSNVLLPLILHGVQIHMAAVPFPRTVEQIFKRHPAMVVAAVPSIWRAWHRAGILPGAPIALAISAGAPLALALERDVYEGAGLKIRNFYGASECGGISLDGRDGLRELASEVGTALPGVEVSVRKDGRLLIESSNVATGYDAPREDDLLGGGVYLTRDLGRVDELGRVHLTGTLGGAINVAGRKISPAKVEAAILATGTVERVKVFGVASVDPERFEEIVCHVLPKEGVSLDEVKSQAAQCMQAWELPRHWRTGEDIEH